MAKKKQLATLRSRGWSFSDEIATVLKEMFGPYGRSTRIEEILWDNPEVQKVAKRLRIKQPERRSTGRPKVTR